MYFSNQDKDQVIMLLEKNHAACQRERGNNDKEVEGKLAGVWQNWNWDRAWHLVALGSSMSDLISLNFFSVNICECEGEERNTVI